METLICHKNKAKCARQSDILKSIFDKKTNILHPELQIFDTNIRMPSFRKLLKNKIKK